MKQSMPIAADRPLILAGAGKMGGAMLAGWLENGVAPAAITVIDPSPPDSTSELMGRSGIIAEASAPPGVTASVLVLAVKPQAIAEAMLALRPLVDASTVVLSIAAGTTLATLAAGAKTQRVIRAMPNTPAQVGRGMTVMVAGRGVEDRDRALASALMEAVGAVEWIADEALMDAVTAVSGSGPAYVFLLAECMAEAGIEAGLDPTLARRLADATVAGAGALLAESGEDPATLRRNVTSPGGTTAAALEVLTAPVGLSPLIRRAVSAAKKRAGELG